MKVVNLAHGETILLGSYLLSFLFMQYGLSPLIGMWLALVVGLAFGFIVYWMLIHKIVGHVDIITLRIEMSTLLAMFTLSIVLFNLYSYFTGSEPRGIGLWHIGQSSFINIGVMSIQLNHLLAAFMSVVAFIGLSLYISKSASGKAIRAVMQDSQAAALVGIDPVKIKLLTSILSLGITSFSGVMVILYESAVVPSIAYKYAALAFTIVVLGGLGSILGSFVGGIIIGAVYGVSKVLFSLIYNPNASDPLALSMAFIILVLVLLLRPEGLFGERW